MSLGRSELVANIRNYFQHNKAISFDELGLVQLKTTSSQYNAATKVLSPPLTFCEFSEQGRQIPSDFIAFLSKKEDINILQAEVIWNKFIRSVKADLDIIGKAILPGLGIFRRVEGQTKFVIEEDLISKHFYGLPSLNVQPLIKLPSKEKEKVHSIPTIEAVKAGWRKELWNAAAAAAIFALLFLAYRYTQPAHSSTLELGVTDNIEIDNARLNKNPQSVLVDSEHKSELIPGLITSENEENKCALILGSFSSKSNAVALQDKILTTPYDLYTEEFHEFFRIGVSVECSEVNGALFREVEHLTGVDPWLRIY